MSTKCSILYEADRFHLYYDMADAFRSDTPDQPIYLELEDCAYQANFASGRASVVVAIPDDVARKIGLLRARASDADEAKHG